MNRAAAGGWLAACALLSVSAWAGDASFGELTARVQAITPTHVLAAELAPGVLRLAGCDAGTDGPRSVKRAAPFEVAIYLEFLPECEAPFEQELLVSLGTADIARIPLRFDAVQPGAVVKQTLSLYTPRNAPLGTQPLKAGLVRKGAPGEARQCMSPRMAPLMELDVQSAEAAESIPDASKAVLLASVDSNGRGMLANGGFESGFRNWSVGEGIQEGMSGWNRVLGLALDNSVRLAGEYSLRIDFCGGQDVNFFHLTQDIPAQGSCEYVVRYFIKTQDITSHEGPGLAVRDPDLPITQFYAVTPKAMRLTGVHEWTPVEFSFQTPARTKRLRIIVRRDGSGPETYLPARFGPIGGSAWFDQIQVIERQRAAS